MARANGVTCRDCGCLNFSSEHEVCDKCRSKTLTFRSTARRSSTSHGGVTTSSSRRSENSGSRAHSNGKKRRYDETKSTLNKKHEGKKRTPVPPSKKQPDVIDLISDDDEDVVVQKVVREGLKPTRKKEKKENYGLFQSRVFPTVTFKANDFPTMEEGTLMRKKAAEKGLSHSQSTGVRGAMTVKSGQTSASQPTLMVSRQVQEKIDPKPAEPRPPPVVEEKKDVKTAVTVEKKKEVTEATNVQGEKKAASTSAGDEGKDDKVDDSKEEDPLFQSRVFDSMEFKVSDFATVFDGLAVARRSHPPQPKSSTASSSCNGAIPTVGPAAVATGSSGPKSNEVTGPAKEATVGSSTTTSASPITVTTTSEAKAKVPTEPAVPKESTTATPAAMAKHSATPTSAMVPQPVSKPPTAATAAATAAAKAQPTSAKPKPAAVALPTKTPSQSTPKVVVPPAKAASASSQASSSPAATLKPAVTLTASSTSMPAPAPVQTKPTAETAAAAASASSEPTPAAGSVATKISSAPTTNSDQTHANGSANVLLPKKKQRIDEKQRHTKPLRNAVNTSSDADGVEFVKVNAAPHEVVIVEPPILGYCSPEFLAFMRECGGDDGEEEDDPEEVSRSQLKLLHVVDLTNLSDSEESDTESPMPTPRDGAKQQSIPTSGQGSTTVGQPTAAANMNVSGKGTWYVPTLDSERKRTQPEKVMCELCEEKGMPSRLIRCPTCTKYYHKKCAKENGDENICWNCELGSMIDDSELDAEHAKHESGYLAYLKAIRRSPSSEDGEDEEEEVDENSENEDQEGEEGAGEEDVEMASPAEGSDENNTFSEGSNTHGKRWKEFIGGATADIDAAYHEVTNRIAEELRDEEKRHVYSRGFVSREEFEAQMTEVEEYYINEEARLQQLEREKALEAKKAAEARKAQAAAEQAANGEQPAGSSGSENNAASVPTPAVQNGSKTGGVAASEVPPSSAITTKAPPASAVDAPSSAQNAPETAATVPVATPAPVQSTASQSAAPPIVPTTVPVPGFLSAQTAVVAAVFRAAFSKVSQSPPSKPQ